MNISYLIYGVLVGVFIILASLLIQSNSSDKVVNETKRLTEEQTKVLTEQNRQILKLQEQNNELQRLNICLAQFIIGGNFTDREECQRRVSQGIAGVAGQPSQTNASQGPQDQPNPQPNVQPAPQPTPRRCTLNLLGVCIP